MVLRFHFCAVASVTATVSLSSAGDGFRIDRSPGSARNSASSDGVGRRRLGLRVEVLQQVAGVLGDQVDRMVPDRGDVGLAAADAELAADREAVGLQRLRVDLGDDLRLREVGRADDDRLQVAGDLAAAERVGTAAGRRDQGQHGRQDRQIPPTRLRHTASTYPMSSRRIAPPDTIEMRASTPRFAHRESPMWFHSRPERAKMDP